MSDPKIRASIPGERVDRHGRSVPKIALHRIVVVKPDHIGDLLIAARAFTLLRHFFPRARIELICGPWNVALARQFGLFDEVHGVAIFHEISGEQQDEAVARAVRRDGVRKLENHKLGAFDLAIDLRHDRDSRSVLLSLDARIYAGYGSVSEYPFLDIALPTRPDAGQGGRTDELFLGGHNFHRISGMMPPRGVASRGTGTITADRNAIEVDFLVKGARSPASCGTVADDLRELGVALRGITVSPVGDDAASDGSPPLHLMPRDPAVTLLSGWAAPETWGAWNIGDLGRLRIALPPSRGETHVRVAFAMVAHVNPVNPIVQCEVRPAGEAAGSLVVFQHPRNEAHTVAEIPRSDRVVKLASEPLHLAPGSYSGNLRIYVPATVTSDMSLTLALRGLDSAAALMERDVGRPLLRPGLCDIPFDCAIESGANRCLLRSRSPIRAPGKARASKC